jgi:hypothetical protein
MSKYDSLSQRLAAHPTDEWRPSFSELESVLGFPLPKAARTGRAWWVYDPAKRHCRAWAAEGWEIGDVDHLAGQVVFRRGPATAREIQPPVMRKAAEAASAQMHTNRKLGATAVVAAGAAVVAGLGAMLVRAALRRSK